ncbi:MAG: hypothetical protein ACR2HX_18540 [Pyrinomonadaceae bacterium]
MDKRAELLALGRVRQATRWPGYNYIGDNRYHRGVYECELVSPYTKTAGNVDAKIMVMLQDWASDDFLKGPFSEDSAILGHSRSSETNQNLIRLLQTNFGLTLGDVYGTNLFPFVKLGPMNAPIPPRDLIRAAHEFGMPQVRIVKPRLLICLGLSTFNAVRRVCGLRSCPTVDCAIQNSFDLEDTTTRVWCQAHTGRLGRNNRNKGGLDRVEADWHRMKENVYGKKAFRQNDPQHGVRMKDRRVPRIIGPTAEAQEKRSHGSRVVSATLPLRQTRTVFLVGEDEIARYDHKSKNTWAKIIAYDKTVARKDGHDISDARIVTKELKDGKFVDVPL